MKALTFLTSLLLLIFVSCSDPCKDLNCNEGVCDDGTCICDDGYEGTNCDTEWRTKYIGIWEGVVNCSGEVEDIEMVVTKSESNIKWLTLTADGEAKPGIVEVDKFIIPEELDEDDSFSGVGILLSTDVLQLTLTYKEGSDEQVCTFDLNRK